MKAKNKMPNILQSEKECIVCGAERNLHLHHIYFGRGMRDISDRNGFTCYLCGYHHTQSNEGVHGKNGHELDMYLKQTCQKEFEKTHTRKEFMQLTGKSYL